MNAAIDILRDPQRKPTYADIEALPAHLVGEILAGELVVSPRPAAPHTKAATALGVLVGAPFQMGLGGPGGWWFADAPELSLGVDPRFDPVVPDLAGWRRESMPEFPVTPQFRTVPDWVCEVVSPSTQRHDRVLKLPFYARAGVRHVWLIDPLARILEVYRLVDTTWQLAAIFGGDDPVRAEPFDLIEIPLGALWIPTPAESDPGQAPESHE
jgi:Uma2 family endonuclease